MSPQTLMVATERDTETAWTPLVLPTTPAHRGRTTGRRAGRPRVTSARSCTAVGVPHARALASAGAVDLVRQVGFLVGLVAFSLAVMIGVSGVVLQTVLGR